MELSHQDRVWPQSLLRGGGGEVYASDQIWWAMSWTSLSLFSTSFSVTYESAPHRRNKKGSVHWIGGVGLERDGKIGGAEGTDLVAFDVGSETALGRETDP